MKITRLYLRGYRVFADELDLQLPGGLVGIYGSNGSGKSALVGSVRWTLFGKDRTSKDEVRTTGINTDCVTEVEFEHEGHLYLVRRTLTGTNSTAKAEAHWNGAQVAEGVSDVRKYVESVLGMDDQSFRASVFAEQKQVSAFSDVSPDKRRELVLRLLGITPLEKARDLARTDARDAKRTHEALQSKLPDLDELRERLAVAEDAATGAVTLVDDATKAAAAAIAARDATDQAFEQADELRRTYESIVTKGLTSKKLLEEATERLTAATKEQAELATASTRVAALRPLVDGLPEREHRLAGLRGVDAAELALASLPVTTAPPEPDEAACDAARADAEAAMASASDIAGELRAARAELERAEEAAARSAELSPEGDCPVCGQSLGDAFEQVQSHRAAEVTASKKRVAALEKQQKDATKQQTVAKKAVDAAQAALTKARAAWQSHQEHATRRASAERALADALALLERPPAPGELDALTTAVKEGNEAAKELQRLEGKLERAGTVESEISALAARIDALTAEVDALRVEVKALGYDKDALAETKAARDAARREADLKAKALEDARVAAAKATGAVDAAKDKLADGERAHADLLVLVEDVRHTARVADLLSEFRNTVVQSVGPVLARQAAALFGELTDHEYDALDVDPETYEIKITDAGVEHGLARYSGSETDLANLALRIAISEHVRFQSGGAVGLLVLDEVFGPLDPDRKDRMLLALERLRSRFRQVLVITHDESIKEQLPGAIEVVKLPGRRASARVLTGI
ncbi:MAG: repair protein SbcC/Rad50 [Actinomycetota bacterium]